MRAIDIILLVIVAAAVAGALRLIAVRKKRGSSCCGGGYCSGCDACSTNAGRGTGSSSCPYCESGQKK